MGLRDFKPEIVKIKFKPKSGEQEFEVRGLNADDFTHLVKLHLADLDQAKLLYDAMKADIYTRQNFDKFVLSLIGQAPGLVAEIISLAAGEPEIAPIYRRLPLPVTANALAEIVRMTLEEVGGVVPFVVALQSVFQAVAPPAVTETLTRAVKSFGSTGASAET